MLLLLLTATAWAAGTWLPATGGMDPTGCFVGGSELDGKPVYVAVGFYNGMWVPGKASGPFAYADVAYAGREHQCSEFQLLQGQNYQWIDFTGGAGNYPPSSAVTPANAPGGAPEYVARARFRVPGQPQPIWVPGKYKGGGKVCYFSYGGSEHSRSVFQILVAD